FPDPPARALRRIGVEKEAKIGVWEYDRSDVPSVHDEPPETVGARDRLLAALIGEKGGAQFRDGRKMGNGGIDLGAANFPARDPAGNFHFGAAPGDARSEAERS